MICSRPFRTGPLWCALEIWLEGLQSELSYTHFPSAMQVYQEQAAPVEDVFRQAGLLLDFEITGVTMAVIRLPGGPPDVTPASYALPIMRFGQCLALTIGL